MRQNSFFLSPQFAAFLVAATLIISACFALNQHIERGCIAAGGTVISRVDDFSMCAHR
jgi:hypothetical protein